MPALLLSAPRLTVSRNAAAGALAATAVLSLVALLAAPLVAYVIHRDGVPNHAAHYRLLAAAVGEHQGGGARDAEGRRHGPAVVPFDVEVNGDVLGPEDAQGLLPECPVVTELGPAGLALAEENGQRLLLVRAGASR